MARVTGGANVAAAKCDNHQHGSRPRLKINLNKSPSKKNFESLKFFFAAENKKLRLNFFKVCFLVKLTVLYVLILTLDYKGALFGVE